ncbi:hypothetical protein PMI42_04693 [Bradyrhizobium sp. YR681]|uniref:GAF domain-containing protein n=1 Tax=Bradyrhizobium sp. YR681 TaxID=1144344 RepID=UPI000270F675|nr:GAF domain-containing protein [Bradyrhizobium sp. YR681]EJN11974.1 hypothetical protein PMI42_04693 [Bradyrhizobium sp. YR681]
MNDSEAPSTRSRGESKRWSNLLRRVRSLIDMKWPVVAYRVASAFTLVAIGAMFEHASHSTVAAVSSIYLVVSVVMEYLFSETSKDIEQRAKATAEEESRQSAAEFDMYAVAEDFLTARLRRNTFAVSALKSGDLAIIQYGANSIAKLPAINQTLKDLCDSLSASASKYRMIPRTEAWFRATYMEVQGQPEGERLIYFGWHTRDDNPPRSMSMNVTYLKGEGCAGTAWEKSRPVIEDFKDRHEWKDNYAHQSSNYTSMICVPVTKGYGQDSNKVIGVITVDTHVDLYFGNKGDRTQEDKVASLIRPYGTYIAFISVVDEAMRDLTERLRGAPAPNDAVTIEAETDTQRVLAAPPDALLTTNETPQSQTVRRKPR